MLISQRSSKWMVRHTPEPRMGDGLDQLVSSYGDGVIGHVMRTMRKREAWGLGGVSCVDGGPTAKECVMYLMADGRERTSSDIRTMTGLKSSAVNSALRSLQRLGAIERTFTGGSNTPSIYRIAGVGGEEPK